jgi:Spy/CpxP family protein refolding chaperone
MDRHAKLRAALWLVLLFAAGIVVGSLWSPIRPHRSVWAGWPVAPVEQAWKEQRVTNLREKVGLTAEQEARLGPAMEAAMVGLRQLRTATRKRVGEIVGKNNAAIRETLTPEQREAFDAWLKECQERQAAREGKRKKLGESKDGPP